MNNAQAPTASELPVGIPRMPVFFGRQGGPRQRPDSTDPYPLADTAAESAWVAVEADADHLEKLLPRGFQLAEPLLVVEASSLKRLPWLAGRGYELATVSVPVAFLENGNRVVGRLELVTWENLADPIISGREELGFSKVFADTITQSVDPDTNLVSWSVAWDGTEFLRFEVSPSRPMIAAPSWRAGPTFHYRVLPRTGHWGELEVEQVTANISRTTTMEVVSARVGEGRVKFRRATFEQLPTLVHIVNGLADIPLGKVIDAGYVEVAGYNDAEDTRIVATWPTESPELYDLSR